MRKIRFAPIAGLLLLAACGAASGTADDAVEAYFRTLVGKDEAKIVGLVCREWEAVARADLLSFGENPASAENVECRVKETSDGSALVACTGSLMLDYNGDNRAIDLSRRVYKAVIEDGAWRMCGYAQ